MANLKKRLAGVVCMTVLSIITIITLLPNSRFGTHLQKIRLSTTMDNYSELWRWGSDDESGEGEDIGDGIRLVVFGDSWVDDSVEKHQEGKGRSWPEVLCDEINCTSRLNFAASQPSSDWPALPPTGVKTSNKIHAWAVENTQYLPHEDTNYTLPDLATQIQTFISLPAPKIAPKDTLFVLSLGFWDIYDFARLDFRTAMNVTDRSIDEIFTQLNILYSHFSKTLYPVPEDTNTTITRPRFRIVIPRLFDPTMTPGWITHRPAPLSPSSVAEQQKNAVYLTERWNQMMENTMGSWINGVPRPSQKPASAPIPLMPAAPFQPPVGNPPEKVQPPVAAVLEKGEPPIAATSEEEQTRTDVRQAAPSPLADSPDAEHISREDIYNLPEKDIFYYDTPKLLLDLIVEHQLEDAGLIDASGLGEGDSPYVSVSLPCVRELQDDENPDGMVDVDGFLVCKEPGAYLWWDAFGMGGKANAMVGKEMGQRVTMGRGLRLAGENSGRTT